MVWGFIVIPAKLAFSIPVFFAALAIMFEYFANDCTIDSVINFPGSSLVLLHKSVYITSIFLAVRDGVNSRLSKLDLPVLLGAAKNSPFIPGDKNSSPKSFLTIS